jgi:peptide/nickel transport system ATP-binding protein
MKQRVGIAMALACDPVLLLADDPTSAVDVTIQAQILRELAELTHRTGVAILFITHDLRVISAVCSRVLVLYGGQLVETGPVEALLTRPRHPYTDALLRCMPSVDARLTPLPVVPGASPTDPGALGGCRFHPRCPRRVEPCDAKAPDLAATPDARRLACWNPLDG